MSYADFEDWICVCRADGIHQRLLAQSDNRYGSQIGEKEHKSMTFQRKQDNVKIQELMLYDEFSKSDIKQIEDNRDRILKGGSR